MSRKAERTREVCPLERCDPQPGMLKPPAPNGDQPSRPAPKMPSGIATASSPRTPMKAAIASETMPPPIFMPRASTAGLALRSTCSSRYSVMTATMPAIRDMIRM